MSEEVKNNEEIYNDDPIYEEPSKGIKIGNLDITLCNELIQEINENLNITFVCESEIDVIQEAFTTNKNPIVYGDDSYSGYTVINEFGYKIDNEDITVYRVSLSKPIEEETSGGLTDEQSFAIACAIPSCNVFLFFLSGNHLLVERWKLIKDSNLIKKHGNLDKKFQLFLKGKNLV